MAAKSSAASFRSISVVARESFYRTCTDSRLFGSRCAPWRWARVAMLIRKRGLCHGPCREETFTVLRLIRQARASASVTSLVPSFRVSDWVSSADRRTGRDKIFVLWSSRLNASAPVWSRPRDRGIGGKLPAAPPQVPGQRPDSWQLALADFFSLAQRV